MTIRMSNIFLLRRLHSLSGLVPIGAFLIEHFYTNFKAVAGEQAFVDAIKELRVMLPGLMLPIAEVMFIGLPILFHAFLGIYIAYTMRNNATSYSYARNWLYFFQRVAGVYLFVFIAAHVASMRFGWWGLIQGHESVNDNVDKSFQIVQTDLSDPLILAFYILGIIAVAYHFSYGLWSFGIHWGLTSSERSMKTSQWVCAGIGMAVLAAGVTAALAFV